MKRIVKVTEANIRLGRKNPANGTKCIIFRALRAAFKGQIEYCGFSYFQLRNGRRVLLPEAAKRSQRQAFAFDNRVIKPFTFTVDF